MNELQVSRCLDQVHALLQEEKYLHAVQGYIRLMRTEPRLPEAYLELASLYTELGFFQAALRTLALAEIQVPDNHEIVFLGAMVCLRIHEYDRALKSLERLSGLNLPDVHYHMGIAWHRKNDAIRAEE